MKKLKKIGRIMFVLVLVLIIISTINNRVGNCSVEGNIEGLGTTIAIAAGATNSQKQNFFKLIMVWGGKFSFNANVDEPGEGKIVSANMFFKKASGRPVWVRSKIISFHLEPDEHIVIEGNLKPYSVDYSVKGNNLSEQASQFRKQNLSILEHETQAFLLLDKLEYEGGDPQIIDVKGREYGKIQESYNQKRLDYAKANRSNEIAAIFLQSQSKDSIIRYFPLLAEKVKRTENGQLLQKRIKAWGEIGIGKSAPLFSTITIEGKPFKLPDLKGKFIVLDFWGSWCGYCIKGYPKMRQYYNKYRDKVEIVGIACRDTEADWKKAVQKHQLPWIHVLNTEKLDLTNKYTVDGFPTKIVIDKEGNLVEVFKGESEEFYEKMDALFGK